MLKKKMHYLHSSNISRKCIIKFLNKSIYCICIKSFNIFLYVLQIIVIKWKISYLKNYTLVFNKMNNEDLQHWCYVRVLEIIIRKINQLDLRDPWVCALRAHFIFKKR